jgi:hypothetical protein
VQRSAHREVGVTTIGNATVSNHDPVLTLGGANTLKDAVK